jgi:F-type H+-transporting ATPase subunit epsilon
MKIKLEIVSQEKPLFKDEVDAVTAPASEGEVTILPNHIPLFTKLSDGVVTIKRGDVEEDLAILGGFMDVGPSSRVTILADAAFRADDVNEAKALKAKEEAEKAIQQKHSEVDFRLAENSLRRAILELKVSRRKRTPQPGS